MNIIELITTNSVFLIFISGIFGLVIGSFLNVVIYRLPIILKIEYKNSYSEYFGQPTLTSTENHPFTLAIPNSHCPQCKTPISWWQNIPIISYILLQGKCNNCHSPISWRYPTVEILSCIATIVVAMHFGIGLKTLLMLIMTWSLIAAIFIDIEHRLLPDNITIPLLWIGLLANTSHIFISPKDAIIGAASGYLLLWSTNKFFKMIRKIDGMGYGDFKLFAVFGGWLGWQMLPIILLVASLAGSIVGIGLILYKKSTLTKAIPFGPYLAAAGWLAFFYGPQLVRWYLLR